MTKRRAEPEKRPYDLGKRLEQMSESRAAILRAAQAQLAGEGYRRLTMAALAEESGVTRQTIHNLFGTKTGVLEAVFDLIALESGMERMREAMMLPPGDAQLGRFVGIFCGFWAKNRMLLRRVHGIGAIDPEFGAVIEARNRAEADGGYANCPEDGRRRRGPEGGHAGGTHLVRVLRRAGGELRDEAEAEAVVLQLAKNVLST